MGRTWLIRGPSAGPKCSHADLGDGGPGLAGCLLPGPTQWAPVGHLVPEVAEDPGIRGLGGTWREGGAASMSITSVM